MQSVYKPVSPLLRAGFETAEQWFLTSYVLKIWITFWSKQHSGKDKSSKTR